MDCMLFQQPTNGFCSEVVNEVEFSNQQEKNERIKDSCRPHLNHLLSVNIVIERIKSVLRGHVRVCVR
jgi:hypothetical protein